MTTQRTKHVSVLPGLHEYTATAVVSEAEDFVEMVFSEDVQVCQVAWNSTYEEVDWTLSYTDSTGLPQVLKSVQTPSYVMNTAEGSIPVRTFDLPAGGTLRLTQLDTPTLAQSLVLSCLAERKTS